MITLTDAQIAHINELRQMRDTEPDAKLIEVAEQKMRDELYPALYITWVRELQDYGLFLNQGEPRQQHG